MAFFQTLKDFILDSKSVFLPPYIPLNPMESDADVTADQKSESEYVLYIELSETSSSSVYTSFAAVGQYFYQQSPFKLALPSFNLEAPRVESIVSQRKKKETKLEEYLPMINEVTPTLLISGIEPALDPSKLIEQDVGGVLNCCGDISCTPANKYIPYFALKLKDSQQEQIHHIFYESFCFIQALRMQGKRTLVHCYQGISRSASIVIAFLMLSNNLTYLEAFSAVRMARPIVSPNMSFVYQMVSWWKLRHMNSFGIMRCRQISERLAYELKSTMEEAAELQSAVRDISENYLIKCQLPSSNVFAPICYRLGIFCEEYPIFCLKLVQPDQCGIFPKFDPRFLYLIFGFHDVSLLLIGSDVQQLYRQEYHQFGTGNQLPRILNQIPSISKFSEPFEDQPSTRGNRADTGSLQYQLLRDGFSNPFAIEQVVKKAERKNLQQIHDYLKLLQLNQTYFVAIGRYLLLMHIFELVSLKMRVIYQYYIDELNYCVKYTPEQAVLLHLLNCLNYIEGELYVEHGKGKFDVETHKLSFDSLKVKIDRTIGPLNVYEIDPQHTWECEAIAYLLAAY